MYSPLIDAHRDFVSIQDKEQLGYIMEKYMHGRKFNIKGIPQQISANLDIIPFQEFVRLSFTDSLPEGFQLKDDLIIYTIARRYIEIFLKKLSFEGNSGEFEFISARIASALRQEPRIQVEENKDMWVENFRLSKYTINPNITDMPICVRVAFDAVRPLIQDELPGCQVEFFNDKNLKKKEILAVQKLQQILYLKDLQNNSPYEAPSDDKFLNYEQYLGTSFQKEMSELKHQKLKSMLIFPVNYFNFRGITTPVGYFKLSSDIGNIPLDIIETLQKYSRLVSDKIRDANVRIVKNPQRVTNISKNGIQIKVFDKDVIDVFLSHRNEVVLEVIPMPTFRLSLFGQVMSILVGSRNEYRIGLQFIGGEERRGLHEWQDYVQRIVK